MRDCSTAQMRERSRLRLFLWLRQSEDLLQSPTKAKAFAFRDSLTAFRDWGVSDDEAVVRFMQDNVWNWRIQKPPLIDS